MQHRHNAVDNSGGRNGPPEIGTKWIIDVLPGVPGKEFGLDGATIGRER